MFLIIVIKCTKYILIYWAGKINKKRNKNANLVAKKKVSWPLLSWNKKKKKTTYYYLDVQ